MDAQNSSDEEIITQLDTDPELFGIIIDRYQEKITRYIKRIAHNPPEDIDDLVQEIFIKAYTKAEQFNDKLSFNSWIYRIAHNHTINHWKKSERRKTESLDIEPTIEIKQALSDDSMIEEILRQSDSETTAAALKLVTTQERSMLVLRFFNEYSYREISDIVKIPEGTVATKIHRAKKSLKEKLEAQGITEYTS